MRIALVHEWLTTYAGAERVLEQMIATFPEADFFALCDFLPQEERAFLQGRVPQTTLIQRLPLARSKYRAYLPLMPLAIEKFDLSGYDLVISSSHAVAKGVLTGPEQLHISYVHSPMRYAWDLQHQYLAEAGLGNGLRGWAARWILHRIRLWDVRTANGVDAFVANSNYIARRIWKVYRRKAQVIYPPVDVEHFSVRAAKEPFYLAASRMVPYKRMGLVVDAFAAMPGRRLVVAGDGPELRKIQAKARGAANIEVVGFLRTEVLRDYLTRAQALVFAAEEDFGILPVEAQACGTPVIAYGRGGCRETVVEGVTGLFFDAQTPDAVMDAVERFECCRNRFDPAVIRHHAESFSTDRFRNEFSTFVRETWERFRTERDRCFTG
ncbi:glycosyltransferase family 4 protein [Desulfoglaeba alkanexedens]|uniref:Glycosyltransferase family 4 protein n=1 Tax=Desulfoglaeba alkanexedens ALDC TaxID=980445 RepID=A0A4P8KZ71_9BACT|nr:glycosyltransferase family 4 protein [Desulfoglaeba alkanexedens]QCQ20836.1 glycosyltransferase family 4 protein [Desulfoglaeba alkanexedens ALDC]